MSTLVITTLEHTQFSHFNKNFQFCLSCVCMSLCFVVESWCFSLLRRFQAIEAALAARCYNLSSADLHRELANWFDNIFFLFPLCCLSLFPSLAPSSLFSLRLFISSLCSTLHQLLFLNLVLVSHDEPRGILVLRRNSVALSDPSLIWYFFSSPRCPHSASFLFSVQKFVHTPPRLPQGMGRQVIYIAHHRPSDVCTAICRRACVLCFIVFLRVLKTTRKQRRKLIKEIVWCCRKCTYLLSSLELDVMIDTILMPTVYAKFEATSSSCLA